MSTKSVTKSLTKNVEGFLSSKEGCLLFDLAKRVEGRGVIVEIGSWKGKSSIWLGNGSREGKNINVYAAYHFSGSPEHRKDVGGVWTFDEFKANIHKAGVGNIVVPIVKTSEGAARDFNHPIELLFIDGAHDYHSVKSDYNLWEKKVVDEGVIGFHDSEFEGVRTFLQELINENPNLKFVDFGGSIACVQKTDRISKIGFLTNRQLAKVIMFRGKVAERRKSSRAVAKPLYNFVRNMAKVYRLLLTIVN